MSATPTKSDREPHLPNTSQTCAVSLDGIPTNEMLVDIRSDQPVKPHQTILREIAMPTKTAQGK